MIPYNAEKIRIKTNKLEHRMKKEWAVLFLCLAFFSCQKEKEDPIDSLMNQGRFREASQAIRARIHGTAEKKALEWKLEWMERVRKDYPYSKQEIIQQLKRRMAGFQPEELDTWIAGNLIDSRIIDGERVFLYAAVSNLFWRYPELRKRQIGRPDPKQYEAFLWKRVQAVKEAAEKTCSPHVLPVDWKVRFRLVVRADAVPAGHVVRAWLPFPRSFPHQTVGQLLDRPPGLKWVDPPDRPLRAAYFEKKAEAGKPLVFEMDIRYRTLGVYHSIDPEIVRVNPEFPEEVRPYLKERPPHVVFTPAIRELAKDIVGSEENLYWRAWKIYRWISENIRYSYAPEYSTIPNLSQYTLERKVGDCGQAAMLFITLARYCGIPARWQSGWLLLPRGKTIHDWAEVYLPPYGWIPVEPYMGMYVLQYTETLSEKQKEELLTFYFGGLEGFRYIANSDHSQELYPVKFHFRSDPVDFQRGEVEWQGGNIYFDQFDYDLMTEWKE